MNIKMLKAALVGLVLSVSGFANAGIIYDFQCNDATCGGVDDWGGYFEIIESAVANQSLTGTSEIIDFVFMSPDKGGLTFVLAGLSDDIKITFSADGNLITSITDNGVNADCNASGPEACFTNGLDALFVSETFVNDVGFNSQQGQWIARTQVPEPSTLAILALGVMGLASRQFKKQS
ncbi:PEP-CTERM sorting domain-containing protein [Colwellia sp. RE-S-Sl-9]